MWEVGVVGSRSGRFSFWDLSFIFLFVGWLILGKVYNFFRFVFSCLK